MNRQKRNGFLIILSNKTEHKQQPTTDNQQREAHNFMFENELKSFFDGRDQVVAVYVFGSYAGRKQRAESDVDIAVLFDSGDRTPVGKLLEGYMVELCRLLRKDVHLVAMNFAAEALLKQIFEKGKCIMVNDQKALSRFKMIAYSKIADFGYYRKLFQDGIIRKVMQG